MAPLISRERRRLTALVLLLAYLPACQSWHSETVALQAVIEAKHPDQIRIVRADGTKQVLHQPAVVADTLRGSAREPAIRPSGVQPVETPHGDAGKSILLGIGIMTGWGVAVTSCVRAVASVRRG